MPSVINQILFPSIAYRTIKATGVDVYNSNVVETLEGNIETHQIGDVKWSVSGMTKLTLGGNSKKIVYLRDDQYTKSYDPNTNIETTVKNPPFTSQETPLDTFLTYPALKVKSDDADIAVCGVTGGRFVITNVNGGGRLTFDNPWRTSPATIVALSYRCNSISSSFCGAVLLTDGLTYKIVAADNLGPQVTADILNIAAGSELTLYSDHERLKVVLIEKLVNGNHVVTTMDEVLIDPITITMQTSSLTGKICDPFADKPLFYGYDAANLFKVEGGDVAVAVLDPSKPGITGIAVFTKYGSDCESGYIYRESDGKTCRDASGKRTAPVEGDMVNSYSYSIYKISEAGTTSVTIPTDPDKKA